MSTLFVPISGRIKDLDVRINSIDHSFVGDLKVELMSPDNATTVRLIEHVGGPNNGGDDLVDTVFDDEAPTTIGAGASAAPYTGSFRPQGDQLARFDGKEQQGTWKLRVSDRYENDTGSLLSLGPHDPHRPVRPGRERARHRDPGGAPVARGLPHRQLRSSPPPRPGTQFQCRLDGGDFSPCTSPQEFGNLPEGTHTFEVRAFDSKGNVDGSPAVYTWTVDVTAPAPHIAAAAGATPHVQGNAGTASGDDATVTVDLYSGSAASGAPVQSVVASARRVGLVQRRLRARGRRDLHRARTSEGRRRQRRVERARDLRRRRVTRRPTSRSSPPRTRSPTPPPAGSPRSAAARAPAAGAPRSSVSSKTAARLGLPRRSVAARQSAPGE